LLPNLEPAYILKVWHFCNRFSINPNSLLTSLPKGIIENTDVGSVARTGNNSDS